MELRHRNRPLGGQSRVRAKHPWRKYILLGLGGLTVLFVLGNAIMWLSYRGRVLPNVHVGRVEVGNTPYSQLNSKVPVENLLPGHIKLLKEDTRQDVNPSQLGLAVDWPATEERLRSKRSWLPLLSLVMKRTIPVELAVDETKFDAATKEVAARFTKAALPQRVTFNGSDFVIAEPQAGYRLDEVKFKLQLLDALEKGQADLPVPTIATSSDETGANLSGELAKLQKQLKTRITLIVSGQSKQATAADIGGWYVQNGQTMAFSEEKARAYASSLTASVYNAGDAAAAASYALEKQQEITFVVATDQTPVKYTYCADGRGADVGHLPGFVAKVAAVLGDPRGWNAGNKVAFQRTETNCDFTIWLSASSQMTSFGGLCDPVWSCRSGRNVVINFDRWQGATAAWNAAGGNLEDYRVMVINHEVGHWLGFGHSSCPGPGQPAPVMMQQSIDLRGCAFNPWPTQIELNTLKSSRDVAALHPREEYIGETSSCCCAHCVS